MSGNHLSDPAGGVQGLGLGVALWEGRRAATASRLCCLVPWMAESICRDREPPPWGRASGESAGGGCAAWDNGLNVSGPALASMQWGSQNHSAGAQRLLQSQRFSARGHRHAGQERPGGVAASASSEPKSAEVILQTRC